MEKRCIFNKDILLNKNSKGKFIPCKTCSKEFYISPCQEGATKYCSESCRSKGCDRSSRKTGRYFNCGICGKQKYQAKIAYEKNSKTGIKFCSQKCKTRALKKEIVSYGFKYMGGPKKESNPYVTKMIDGIRYKFHRKVMEDHIGRKLNRNEHVHHINGDKKDNRIDNLQIVSPSQHAKLHHPPIIGSERQHKVNQKK